jgi:hypothetical protein
MAKVEVKTEHVICDRPGCGKRITDKGGIMDIHASESDNVADVMFIGCGSPMPPGTCVDLCRECMQQMGNAWNRKADGE